MGGQGDDFVELVELAEVVPRPGGQFFKLFVDGREFPFALAPPGPQRGDPVVEDGEEVMQVVWLPLLVDRFDDCREDRE